MFRAILSFYFSFFFLRFPSLSDSATLSCCEAPEVFIYWVHFQWLHFHFLGKRLLYVNDMLTELYADNLVNVAYRTSMLLRPQKAPSIRRLRPFLCIFKERRACRPWNVRPSTLRTRFLLSSLEHTQRTGSFRVRLVSPPVQYFPGTELISGRKGPTNRKLNSKIRWYQLATSQLFWY